MAEREGPSPAKRPRRKAVVESKFKSEEEKYRNSREERFRTGKYEAIDAIRYNALYTSVLGQFVDHQKSHLCFGSRNLHIVFKQTHEPLEKLGHCWREITNYLLSRSPNLTTEHPNYRYAGAEGEVKAIIKAYYFNEPGPSSRAKARIIELFQLYWFDMIVDEKTFKDDDQLVAEFPHEPDQIYIKEQLAIIVAHKAAQPGVPALAYRGITSIVRCHCEYVGNSLDTIGWYYSGQNAESELKLEQQDYELVDGVNPLPILVLDSNELPTAHMEDYEFNLMCLYDLLDDQIGEINSYLQLHGPVVAFLDATGRYISRNNPVSGLRRAPALPQVQATINQQGAIREPPLGYINYINFDQQVVDDFVDALNLNALEQLFGGVGLTDAECISIKSAAKMPFVPDEDDPNITVPEFSYQPMTELDDKTVVAIVHQLFPSLYDEIMNSGMNPPEGTVQAVVDVPNVQVLDQQMHNQPSVTTNQNVVNQTLPDDDDDECKFLYEVVKVDEKDT